MGGERQKLIGRSLHLTAFAIALVVLLAAGCVGTTIQPTEGKQAPQDELPAPNITLSLNRLSECAVFPGAPILVEAVFSPPDGRDSKTEVTLSNSGNAWGEMVSLEIRNAQDEAVPGISFQSLYATEQSITLNHETLGAMAWCIVSESGATLPSGEYAIVAVLDSTASISGWRGKTKSAPSTLTVKSSLSQLSADEARLVTLGDVRIRSYIGEHESALAVVDAFLVKNPKDGLMLEERADVLARMERFSDALSAYNLALDNVAPQEESLLREPPHNLLRKRDMAASKVESGAK